MTEIFPQPRRERHESLLTLCLLAALADGEMGEGEREKLRVLAGEAGGEVEAAMREILLGRGNLTSVADAFDQQEQKLLAYEMARAVCEADGGVNVREQAFLEDLRGRLGLDIAEARAADAEVDAIVLANPASSAAEAPAAASAPDTPTAVSNESRIMRSAILCGALEILPGSLATMAILPLQMKLVHDIARSHGVALGAANIKDFLAVLGVGMASSQMVEGFARKLLGGLGKTAAGKLGRALGRQAAGSAMSFATTYAIGYVADRYYAGGQTLPVAEIRSLMGELTRRAQELYFTKRPEIEATARNLNPSSILEAVRGSPGA